MSEREDLAASAARSEAAAQPFSHEEGLSPLNAYFDFAPEDRTDVMMGLMMGSRYLPTADEYYAARRQGGSSEMRIENKYGDLAFAYARAVDPNFTDDQINGDSRAAQNRRKFYRMIRSLTAEQIDIGVLRILNIEAAQATSKQQPPTSSGK